MRYGYDPFRRSWAIDWRIKKKGPSQVAAIPHFHGGYFFRGMRCARSSLFSSLILRKERRRSGVMGRKNGLSPIPIPVVSPLLPFGPEPPSLQDAAEKLWALNSAIIEGNNGRYKPPPVLLYMFIGRFEIRNL